MEEPRYIVIHSLSMANHLVRCGNDIKKVDDSENDNRLKVFLFHDTGKLRNDMGKFQKARR